VVESPAERFREVYELLDEPVPDSTLRQMQSMATKGQKRNLTTRWQKGLKLAEQQAIAQKCDEFFRLLGIPVDEIPPSSMTTATPAPRRGKSRPAQTKPPRQARRVVHKGRRSV